MVDAVTRLDLHGKNVYQARIAIEAALRRSRGVCRLRLIHGFHGGESLKTMIREEYAAHPKVLRLQAVGSGTTDLVLREL